MDARVFDSFIRDSQLELPTLGLQRLSHPYLLTGMLPKMNLRISMQIDLFSFLDLSKLFRVLLLALEIGFFSWIICIFTVLIILTSPSHYHSIQ